MATALSPSATHTQSGADCQRRLAVAVRAKAQVFVTFKERDILRTVRHAPSKR